MNPNLIKNTDISDLDLVQGELKNGMLYVSDLKENNNPRSWIDPKVLDWVERIYTDLFVMTNDIMFIREDIRNGNYEVQDDGTLYTQWERNKDRFQEFDFPA